MHVTVGSRRQWVEIAGEGAPAVVFESGCGGTSDDWSAIRQVVSEQTTVLTYDRAGSGRSEPSSADRRVSVMAEELRRLLDQLPINPPLVLVGLSLGGLIVREFARRWPGDVCALLLLEPAHEALELTMPADYWAQEQKELAAAARANRNSRPGFVSELESLPETTREMREISDHSLGALPLTVVTARQKWGDVHPPISREAVDAAWVELHRRTAALSTQGQLVEAAKSGHNVHRDDPELVIRELLGLRARCRR